MIVVFAFFALIVASVWIFVRQPKFGKTPSGVRMERVRQSPNFRNGKFQNRSHTPNLTEGKSYVKVMTDFLFNRSKRMAPADTLPSQKADLKNIRRDQNVLVWFGHSSYFMQVDGRRFLVDPVLSGQASPLPNTVRSFRGADIYSADEIPDIDYLFISHDHWDHLDHDTLVKLRPRIRRIVTGIGTAAHLEHWGYSPSSIIEKDWGETVELENGFVVNTLSARHFSGRAFSREQSLWMSFALRTPSMNIFVGGDSGYDKHFKEIGELHGPFDLVILECGQYNENWKYIHSMPDEVILEARELKGKRLMPVHWGKFALAQHSWDEPIISVSALAKSEGLPLLTPMIGELVDLKSPISTDWWVGLK